MGCFGPHHHRERAKPNDKAPAPDDEDVKEVNVGCFGSFLHPKHKHHNAHTEAVTPSAQSASQGFSRAECAEPSVGVPQPASQSHDSEASSKQPGQHEQKASSSQPPATASSSTVTPKAATCKMQEQEANGSSGIKSEILALNEEKSQAKPTTQPSKSEYLAGGKTRTVQGASNIGCEKGEASGEIQLAADPPLNESSSLMVVPRGDKELQAAAAIVHSQIMLPSACHPPANLSNASVDVMPAGRPAWIALAMRGNGSQEIMSQLMQLGVDRSQFMIQDGQEGSLVPASRALQSVDGWYPGCIIILILTGHLKVPEGDDALVIPTRSTSTAASEQDLAEMLNDVGKKLTLQVHSIVSVEDPCSSPTVQSIREMLDGVVPGTQSADFHLVLFKPEDTMYQPPLTNNIPTAPAGIENQSSTIDMGPIVARQPCDGMPNMPAVVMVLPPVPSMGGSSPVNAPMLNLEGLYSLTMEAGHADGRLQGVSGAQALLEGGAVRMLLQDGKTAGNNARPPLVRLATPTSQGPSGILSLPVQTQISQTQQATSPLLLLLPAPTEQNMRIQVGADQASASDAVETEVSEGQTRADDAVEAQVSEGQTSAVAAAEDQVFEGQTMADDAVEAEVSEGKTSALDAAEAQVFEGQTRADNVVDTQVSEGQTKRDDVAEAQVSEGQASKTHTVQVQLLQSKDVAVAVHSEKTQDSMNASEEVPTPRSETSMNLLGSLGGSGLVADETMGEDVPPSPSSMLFDLLFQDADTNATEALSGKDSDLKALENTSCTASSASLQVAAPTTPPAKSAGSEEQVAMAQTVEQVMVKVADAQEERHLVGYEDIRSDIEADADAEAELLDSCVAKALSACVELEAAALAHLGTAARHSITMVEACMELQEVSRADLVGPSEKEIALSIVDDDMPDESDSQRVQRATSFSSVSGIADESVTLSLEDEVMQMADNRVFVAAVTDGAAYEQPAPADAQQPDLNDAAPVEQTHSSLLSETVNLLSGKPEGSNEPSSNRTSNSQIPAFQTLPTLPAIKTSAAASPSASLPASARTSQSHIPGSPAVASKPAQATCTPTARSPASHILATQEQASKGSKVQNNAGPGSNRSSSSHIPCTGEQGGKGSKVRGNAGSGPGSNRSSSSHIPNSPVSSPTVKSPPSCSPRTNSLTDKAGNKHAAQSTAGSSRSSASQIPDTLNQVSKAVKASTPKSARSSASQIPGAFSKADKGGSSTVGSSSSTRSSMSQLPSVLASKESTPFDSNLGSARSSHSQIPSSPVFSAAKNGPGNRSNPGSNRSSHSQIPSVFADSAGKSSSSTASSTRCSHSQIPGSPAAAKDGTPDVEALPCEMLSGSLPEGQVAEEVKSDSWAAWQAGIQRTCSKELQGTKHHHTKSNLSNAHGAVDIPYKKQGLDWESSEPWVPEKKSKYWPLRHSINSEAPPKVIKHPLKNSPDSSFSNQLSNRLHTLAALQEHATDGVTEVGRRCASATAMSRSGFTAHDVLASLKAKDDISVGVVAKSTAAGHVVAGRLPAGSQSPAAPGQLSAGAADVYKNPFSSAGMPAKYRISESQGDPTASTDDLTISATHQ